MFDFEKELKNLPDQPGVYLMHDKNDTIIYVGKAKILKNRVRQYFQNSANHTPKVKAMVSNVARFEYIVTDSEMEALALECNLIKKHRPKYNILLKDDKHYPYLKVTMNEDWPRIFKTRVLKNDGAKYFGPYMGINTIKNTLEIIQKIFLPPTCRRKFPQDIGKGRPCLNYHIKNCFAPCTGNVSQKEYKQVFRDVCDFLEGDHKKLVSELESKMKELSKNMEFEKAALYRDKIKAINSIDEKQKVINSDKQNDVDIIALCKKDDNAFVEIFFVRSGKLTGRENYRLEFVEDSKEAEIMTDFIKQFYQDAKSYPDEIITQYDCEDAEIISGWISELKGKKVIITYPKRGEKVKLVEMVFKNAEVAMNNFEIYKKRYEEKSRITEELTKLLGFKKPLRLIESYDISNIQGADNVASMVVFCDGKPLKSRYRKFRIKSFEGADDYRAMQEVIYRRLNEAREEQEQVDLGTLKLKDARFLPLPDAFFLDGGKGHIESVKKVLEVTDTDIPVFGMVKDDKHRTRALLSPEGEIGVSPTSQIFYMITRLQDEVHRTAISYHRSLHEKIVSELDEIEGIGPSRRTALYEHFKTIENIKKAGIDELMNVKGMNRAACENIINHFKNSESEN